MKRFSICAILLVVMAITIFPICAFADVSGIPVGGATILKTDVSGKPLEGAVFQIVRELRDGELRDQEVNKQIVKIGKENRIMTAEYFWDNRQMQGERCMQIQTDAEGRAILFGLPYGTYYLVEKTAPEGYNKIGEPIRVAIHKYSHLTEEDGVRDDKNVLIDNTLHIINVRYSLPDTGHLAMVQLVAAGVGILFSSAALLLMNRHRWK